MTDNSTAGLQSIKSLGLGLVHSGPETVTHSLPCYIYYIYCIYEKYNKYVNSLQSQTVCCPLACKLNAVVSSGIIRMEHLVANCVLKCVSMYFKVNLATH